MCAAGTAKVNWPPGKLRVHTGSSPKPESPKRFVGTFRQ